MNLRDPWNNIKLFNVYVTGIPRERGAEKNAEDMTAKK